MRDLDVKITLVGGPIALLEMSGLRLLTDSTFDPAGGEHTTGAVALRRLSGPALGVDAIGHVDAVLLSHDQHFDNLDRAGRGVLAQAGRVFTTPSGSERLGDVATGLKTSQSAELSAPGGHPLRITATPARHGPARIEPFSEEVTGFVLAFDDRPDGEKTPRQSATRGGSRRFCLSASCCNDW
jgi:L-ascorbate metabolism protein UlaG (beta-lactamase superfamily)